MQWERKLYGLHTEVRPTVLWLNETLFASAGLIVPTTAWTGRSSVTLSGS